jgi:hypothetical protein
MTNIHEVHIGHIHDDNKVHIVHKPTTKCT